MTKDIHHGVYSSVTDNLRYSYLKIGNERGYNLNNLVAEFEPKLKLVSKETKILPLEQSNKLSNFFHNIKNVKYLSEFTSTVDIKRHVKRLLVGSVAWDTISEIRKNYNKLGYIPYTNSVSLTQEERESIIKEALSKLIIKKTFKIYAEEYFINELRLLGY